jgi:hypothetical protein
MIFEMLLCGECYENVWIGSLYAFNCKRFRKTRRTVTLGITLYTLFETPCIISGSHIEL